MENVSIIILFLFVLFTLLGSGVWVGLALMGVAWFGMEMFTTRPVGDVMLTTIWTSSSSWTLTALPLFIWMGEVLYRTRLSEDMFRGLSPWMARLPGGLVHTNIAGCTVFAAVSGSSAATLTTVGKMSIPELRKRNYPEKMIIGTLAGAATLGLMIPPSLTLIVYGVTINESITKLFFAGILPGIVLAAMFMGYVAIMHFLTPSTGMKDDDRTFTLVNSIYFILMFAATVFMLVKFDISLFFAIGFYLLFFAFMISIRGDKFTRLHGYGFLAGSFVVLLYAIMSEKYKLILIKLSDGYSLSYPFTPDETVMLIGIISFITVFLGDVRLREKLWLSRFLIPVISLIVVVIGSMYLGYATATEAAAFGVIGAMLLAAGQRSLTWKTFTQALMGATRTSAMIALILAGASFLSLSMGFTGLPRGLADMIAQWDLTRFELLMVLLVFYIILGMFLDGISSVVLTMAVVEPMIRDAGIDLIWFGIFIVVVIEMAQITPPIGFNLFVLQGMTDHEMGFIAKAAIPMFLIMVLMVFVLILFPDLATYLPNNMRTINSS